jgi:uncharacterized protein (TIGR02466 family)
MGGGLEISLMFKIHELFPTPIIHTNIGREITKEEFAYAESHFIGNIINESNSSSLDNYVLEKGIPEIKNFILSGIDYYVKNIIDPRYEMKFFITQSWFNYTQPKQYHHKHSHPNSIISGVFYFNVDENEDGIIFFNDAPRQINILPKEFKNYNTNVTGVWKTLPIKNGDLILFPSSIEHMVEKTTTNKIRISLAFNVFARGYFGEEDASTALYL